MGLDVGTLLDDRYEIVRAVNKGGMGAVYEAIDRRLANSRCAVKELLDDWQGINSDDAKLIREKLEMEMQFLVNLQHPGIPRIRDAFAKGDAYYLVMDFIEGSDLENLLAQQLKETGAPLPADQVRTYALEVLEILEYLHTLDPPVLHRDIKPANIIREEARGKLKLVDFGLARQMTQSRAFTSVGTMGYLPLEQASGDPDQRSDIYALGATLHCLITGKPPVPFRIQPVLEVCPGADPELAVIIDKAVAREAEDRFPTAAAMKAALQGKAPAVVSVPSPAPSPPPAAQPSTVSPEPARPSTVSLAPSQPAPAPTQPAAKPVGGRRSRSIIPPELCPGCGAEFGPRDKTCGSCGQSLSFRNRIFAPSLSECQRFLLEGGSFLSNLLVGTGHLYMLHFTYQLQGKIKPFGIINWSEKLLLLGLFALFALSLAGFIGELLRARIKNHDQAPSWPHPKLGVTAGLGVGYTCLVVFMPMAMVLIVAFSMVALVSMMGYNQRTGYQAAIMVVAIAPILYTMFRGLAMLPVELGNYCYLDHPPPLFDSATPMRQQVLPAVGAYLSFLVVASVALLGVSLLYGALAQTSVVLAILVAAPFQFAYLLFWTYFLGVLYRDKLMANAPS